MYYFFFWQMTMSAQNPRSLSITIETLMQNNSTHLSCPKKLLIAIPSMVLHKSIQLVCLIGIKIIYVCKVITFKYIILLYVFDIYLFWFVIFLLISVLKLNIENCTFFINNFSIILLYTLKQSYFIRLHILF